MRLLAFYRPLTVLLQTCFLVLLSSVVFSGCACLGSSSPPPEVYTLEYAPPIMGGRLPISEAIRVSRFAPVEAFAVTTMIIRTAPHKRDVYPAAWWSVHPGFLITDFLIRDMRQSGLFRGVFSYRDDAEARFALGGTVEEFLEEDGEGGAAAAVLTVNATLQDLTGKKGPAKGMVFQKAFREREPLAVKSPQEFARAMSRAVERLSRTVQNDVYEAIAGMPQEKPEK